MKELNKFETKEINGGWNYGGYWGNTQWNNNEHSGWANQWFQAGRDAWNNRQPGRGYPGQSFWW